MRRATGLGLLLICWAAIVARPSCAAQRYRMSRYLVRTAWLVEYVPAFLIGVKEVFEIKQVEIFECKDA